MDDVPVEGWEEVARFLPAAKWIAPRSLSSLCERNCARRGARICATRWLAKTKSAHRVQQTGMTGKADEGRFAIVTDAR